MSVRTAALGGGWRGWDGQPLEASRDGLEGPL